MLLFSTLWIASRARPYLVELDEAPARAWAIVLGARVSDEDRLKACAACHARALGLDAIGVRAPERSGASARSRRRAELRELFAHARALVDGARA